MEEADKLRQMGNECYSIGQMVEAIKFYGQSLMASKTAITLSNRSQAYLQICDYENALVDAIGCLDFDPANLKGLYRKAVALLGLGRPSEALPLLEDLLKREPANKQFLEHKKIAKQRVQIIYEELEIYSRHSSHSNHAELKLATQLNPQAIDVPRWFKSPDELREELAKKVDTIAQLKFHGTLTSEWMEFFRKTNRAYWSGGDVAVDDLVCTKAEFDELFGGNIFQPIRVHFCGTLKGIDLNIAVATLPPLGRTKLLHLRCTDWHPFGRPTLRISFDTILNFLHTQQGPQADPPLPIPLEYMTHCSTYQQLEYDKQNGMRHVWVDLDSLDVRDSEFILNQCIKRFKEEGKCRVSYRLLVQCPRNVSMPRNDVLDSNKLGEKLQVTSEHLNSYSRFPGNQSKLLTVLRCPNDFRYLSDA